MAQVVFDTLKFVRTLEKSGISAVQAEAISVAVQESHESIDVATKRDLDDLRKDLTTQITDVRRDLTAQITDIRKDMEKLGLQLTIWLDGVVIVAVGAMTTILKIL